MRIVKHALGRLGVVGVRIMVLDVEILVVDDDTRERKKFTELSDYFRALEAVHERLVLDIHNRNDSILQSPILANFDGLEEPLVAIHETLVRVLRTELRVGKLGNGNLFL